MQIGREFVSILMVKQCRRYGYFVDTTYGVKTNMLMKRDFEYR